MSNVPPAPDAFPNRTEIASAVFTTARAVERSLRSPGDPHSLFYDLRVRVLPDNDATTVHLRLAIRYGVRLPEAAARLQDRIRQHLHATFALSAVHVIIDVKDLIFDADTLPP